MSERLAWFSIDDLGNMIAISQCTPGPLGINMATYVGYSVHGIVGGIFATVALVVPSLIIIISISKVLDKFKNNVYILKIFALLRPCVVGFIVSAVLTIFLSSVCDHASFLESGKLNDLFLWKEMLLFIGMTFFIRKYKHHQIVYIAIAMIIGIVFQF